MPANSIVEETKCVIWGDNHTLGTKVAAMELLCSSPETLLVDLLSCLKHPNKVINWAAAQELHRRTERPENDDGCVEFLFLDYQDWCDYLGTRPDLRSSDGDRTTSQCNNGSP